MSRCVIAALCLALVGCDFEHNTTQNEAEKRRCTEEQLALVEAEYLICDSSTYMSSYCYDRAVINHCPRREEEQR